MAVTMVPISKCWTLRLVNARTSAGSLLSKA